MKANSAIILYMLVLLFFVTTVLSLQGCNESRLVDNDDASDARCQNGVCEPGENCTSCQEDCGSCQNTDPACPDDECNGDENCSSCPQDCGICQNADPVCPDGECNGDENCSSCPQDCGNCQLDRPNIVFIFADDLGYGDLASYGHPYSRTPNLDRLAEQGTQFHRFYVTGVTCNPSRTGFMTSRHPASYANYTADFGFQDRNTITELLGKAGYTVGHFGKWHIGNNESAKDGVYGINNVEVIGGDKDSPNGRDSPIFEAAMRFIEDNRQGPFYVNVWGHATHFPVDPANSLAKEFSDVTCDRADFSNHMQGRFDDCEAIGGNIELSMRNYLGDVYGIDISVGRLLDKIDELGLRDNTIVVFSSDQGPAPIKEGDGTDGEKARQNMLGYAGGLRGTKHTQYEGGVRSPFIIRWPGRVPAGKVNRESIFSGIDWLPTLASIAGLSIDESWYEGEDVSDIWMGANRSRTNPLFWKLSKSNAMVSMLQGNWKMHLNGDNVELYNLKKDEAETRNLAASQPDIVKKLITKVDEWQSQLPTKYAKETDSQIKDPVQRPKVIGPANL